MEVNGIAVPVGENLHLDVPWTSHIFFDENAGIAEGSLGFALSAFQRRIEVGMAVDAPHALAPAAGDGLDKNRVADLVRFLFEEFRLLPIAMVPGNDGYAGTFHQRLGPVFQSHGVDRSGWRANKGNAYVEAGLGEIGILREKAVTRMNALRARRLGCRDQFLDRKIALRW